MADIDIQAYMELYIKRIDEKNLKVIQAIDELKSDLKDKFSDLKTDQKVCQARCDTVRGDLYDRLQALEKNEIRSSAIHQMLEQIERRALDEEIARNKKRNFFWLKMGGFIALVQVLSAYAIFFLSYMMR